MIKFLKCFRSSALFDKFTLYKSIGSLKVSQANFSTHKNLINQFEEDPDLLNKKCNLLIKEKFFYQQSSSIYGGLKGAYDFGPYGCNIKNNILLKWRQRLLNDEDMLEIDGSILTSVDVLKSSGHLNHFADYFVKDSINGLMYRCDHLIRDFFNKPNILKNDRVEHILNNLSEMSTEELLTIIKEFNIKGPIAGGDLIESGQFNLMFSVDLASENNHKCYLRPETAQGIFVNFQQLAIIKQNKLPFGVGQIGTVFRNEINPEHKLIRAREFQMAEIEYFYDPKVLNHERFNEVAHLEMQIWSANDQSQGIDCRLMTLQDIVYKKMINENHAYFLGKIFQFLIEVGIKKELIRFRQHQDKETAHYSSCCWDAECLTSLGWIECVGCSNRSDYDLRRHSEQSGEHLHIEQYLNNPITSIETSCCPASRDSFDEYQLEYRQSIKSFLKTLSHEDIEKLRRTLELDGQISIEIDDKTILLNAAMLKFTEKKKTIFSEFICPHVIEPSFGIGRIIQVIIEHNFYYRENDHQRVVLTFPVDIAPYHCCILPLFSKPAFRPCINEITQALKKKNIRYIVDNANESVGRRYSRNDQIGIPFAITIDHDSINKTPISVTIRERDSMKQIRVQIEALPQLILDLVSKNLLWSDVFSKHKQLSLVD